MSIPLDILSELVIQTG